MIEYLQLLALLAIVSAILYTAYLGRQSHRAETDKMISEMRTVRTSVAIGEAAAAIKLRVDTREAAEKVARVIIESAATPIDVQIVPNPDAPVNVELVDPLK